MFALNTSADTMQGSLLAEITARQPRFQAQAVRQAMALYRGVRLQANLARFWARLTRHARGLASLAATAASAREHNRHYLGARTVAIKFIRGSENRTRDFDRDFLPLQKRTRERWLSVATARLCGVTLPAVELLQVGDAYYVRDGHHRISVAKALGENYIDAEVTAW